MNNFNQKNIIYNLTGNSKLPTPETVDVSLKTNQIIYTSINNAFNKMVDNDLYIERSIINNSNYIYGPFPENKLSGIIDSTPEGTKYWGGISNNTELSILQKYQIDLSSTLSCVIPYETKSIFTKNNDLFVGTTNGLYVETETKFKFDKNNTILSSVTVNDYYYKQKDLTLVATSDGLYTIQYLSSGSEIKRIDSTVGININNVITMPMCGNVIKKTIIFGTNSGFYTAEYELDSNNDIKYISEFVKSEYFTNDNIKSLTRLDDTSFLIGSNNGLYNSKDINVLTYPTKIPFVGGANSIKCTACVPDNFFDGFALSGVTTLVGTTDGIYYISLDNKLIKLVNNYDSRINDIQLVNGNLLVASTQGLYQFNKTTNTLDSVNLVSGEVNSICIGYYDATHTYLYAARLNSIYYVNIYNISDLTTLKGVNSAYHYVEELDTYIWKRLSDVGGGIQLLFNDIDGYLFSINFSEIIKYKLNLNLYSEKVFKKYTQKELLGNIINTVQANENITLLNIGTDLISSIDLTSIYTPLYNINSVDIINHLGEIYCFINTVDGVDIGTLTISLENSITFKLITRRFLRSDSIVKTFKYDDFFIFQLSDNVGKTTVKFINYVLYPDLVGAFVDSFEIITPKDSETLTDGLYILGEHNLEKSVYHYSILDTMNITKSSIPRDNNLLSCNIVSFYTNENETSSYISTKDGLYLYNLSSDNKFSKMENSISDMTILYDDSDIRDWYGEDGGIYGLSGFDTTNLQIYYPSTKTKEVSSIVSSPMTGIVSYSDVDPNIRNFYDLSSYKSIDNYSRFFSTENDLYYNPNILFYTELQDFISTNGIWTRDRRLTKNIIYNERNDDTPYNYTIMQNGGWLEYIKESENNYEIKGTGWDFQSILRNTLVYKKTRNQGADYGRNLLSDYNLLFLAYNGNLWQASSGELSSASLPFITGKFPGGINNIQMSNGNDYRDLYVSTNRQAWRGTNSLSNNIIIDYYKSVGFNDLSNANDAIVNNISVLIDTSLSGTYFSVGDFITKVSGTRNTPPLKNYTMFSTDKGKLITFSNDSIVNNKITLNQTNSSTIQYNLSSDFHISNCSSICPTGYDAVVGYYNQTNYTIDISQVGNFNDVVKVDSVSLYGDPSEDKNNNLVVFEETQIGNLYLCGFYDTTTRPPITGGCSPAIYKFEKNTINPNRFKVGPVNDDIPLVRGFSDRQWNVAVLFALDDMAYNDNMIKPIMTSFTNVNNNWTLGIYSFNKKYSNVFNKLVGTSPFNTNSIKSIYSFNNTILIGTSNGLYYFDIIGTPTTEKLNYSNVRKITINNKTNYNIHSITSHRNKLFLYVDNNVLLYKEFNLSDTGIITPNVTTVLRESNISFEIYPNTVNKYKYEANKINYCNLFYDSSLYDMDNLYLYSSDYKTPNIYQYKKFKTINEIPTKVNSLIYNDINNIRTLNDGINQLYVQTKNGIYTIPSYADVATQVKNNIVSSNINYINYVKGSYYVYDNSNLSSILTSEFLTDGKNFDPMLNTGKIRCFNSPTNLQTLTNPNVIDIFPTNERVEFEIVGYEKTPLYLTNHIFYSFDILDKKNILSVGVGKGIDEAKFISNKDLLVNVYNNTPISSYAMIYDNYNDTSYNLSVDIIQEGKQKEQIIPTKFYQTDSGDNFVFYINSTGSKLYSRNNKNQYVPIYNYPLYFTNDDINPKIISDNKNKINVYKAGGYYIFDEYKYKYCLNLLYGLVDVNTIYVDSANYWLLGCVGGLFKYTYKYFDYGGDLIVKVPYLKNKNVTSVVKNDYFYDKITKENIKTYSIAADSSIYNSSNLNIFRNVIDLSSTGISKINSLYPRGEFEYLIGTNNGLYKTSYEYSLSNTLNISNPDIIDKNLSSIYDEKLSSHIEKYHNLSSIVTKINNDIMPIDFSEISDGWQKNHNNISSTTIINDIVDTVDFGDSNSSSIKSYYCNYLTKNISTNINEYKPLVSPNYIIKNWKSGIKEIYVYMPTTNTYYISHNENIPNCNNYDLEIVRDNLPTNYNISGKLQDNYTHIKLEFDNTFFNIEELLSIEVNGNSLPLQIYKDTKNGCSGAEDVYHSFILPSIAVVNSTTKDNGRYLFKSENDKITFSFICYGSDAQAVRIISTSVKQFNFIFNKFISDGGILFGDMDQQTLRTDKLPKNLEFNSYVKHGSIFTGWSGIDSKLVDVNTNAETINTFPTMDNIVAYNNQLITKDSKLLKMSENINLYPVFSNYDFSNNDTLIVMDVDGDITYNINNIEYIDKYQTVVIDNDYIIK